MINWYGDMTDWHSKRTEAVEVLSRRRARCRLRIGALLAQGSDEADAHRNSAKWRNHGHGRILAPIMPWMALSQLTPSDANAIAAYLKSIPAVDNSVPGPFGADEKPSVLVFMIVPGDVYASMPKPPPPK
jgi:hypothetical protein